MEERMNGSMELTQKLMERKEQEFQTAKKLLMKGQHKDSGDHMVCVSLLSKIIREIEEGTF